MCSFRSNTKVIMIKKFDESKKNDYIYKTLKNFKKIFLKPTIQQLLSISRTQGKFKSEHLTLIEKKRF